MISSNRFIAWLQIFWLAAFLGLLWLSFRVEDALNVVRGKAHD